MTCRKCQGTGPRRPGRSECKGCEVRYKGNRLRSTVKGKAERLRQHHSMTPEDAFFWASSIFEPYSRCAVCGIPARILRAYWRYGQMWARSPLLQVDHIDPWLPATMENIRLLCSKCNRMRGAAIRTDEEVLARVRKWYLSRFTLEELWFLNTSPGQGGWAMRGKRHEEEILRRAAVKDDAADDADGPCTHEGRGDTPGGR